MTRHHWLVVTEAAKRQIAVNPHEHEPNLEFTRMLAGPMDFTPGVLSLKGRHAGTEWRGRRLRHLRTPGPQQR